MIHFIPGSLLFLITLLLYQFNPAGQSNFRLTTKIFTDYALFKQLISTVWTGLLSFNSLVFVGAAVVWWKSVLLIYILYSIGSSMTLSKSDVMAALSGFLWMVFLILMFNLLTGWTGDFATRYLALSGQYISAFYFLLILSFIANLLFIVILFLLNLLKSLFI